MLYWPSTQRKDHKKKGCLLVCQICRQNGCTAHDIDLYKCTACGESLGTARFDQQQLKDLKFHGRQKLQCKVCTASQLARISALQKALQKSKVRCKCFQVFHSERCPLSPAYYGQKKWPGCDGHVTQLDRNFLDGLNPRPKWWNKALGRGS